MCCLSLSLGWPWRCVSVQCITPALSVQVWGASAVVVPPLVSGTLPQDYLEQECVLLDSIAAAAPLDCVDLRSDALWALSVPLGCLSLPTTHPLSLSLSLLLSHSFTPPPSLPLSLSFFNPCVFWGLYTLHHSLSPTRTPSDDCMTFIKRDSILAHNPSPLVN